MILLDRVTKVYGKGGKPALDRVKNAEIAATLFMAEGTVKTHIGRLLSKLNARDRVSLVLIAFEAGLV